MKGLWIHRLWVLLAACAFAALASGLASGELAGSELAGSAASLGLHLIFGLTVFLAIASAQATNSVQEFIADSGFPSLRSMAWLTPAVIIIQIVLGSAYRHKLIGAVPHVAWAFAAAIFTMALGAFVLTQASSIPSMKRTATALLSLVAIQVVLGVSALVAKTTGEFQIAGTIHAATGATVLGATAALSALIFGNVKPSGSISHVEAGHHS